MHEATVPTSFELLTATSARLGDSLNRNIKIKYSRSVQICPEEQFDRISTAVAHGSVRCSFRTESRLTNQDGPARLVKGRYPPWQSSTASAAHTPGGYKSLPGSNRSLVQVKKSDAEHLQVPHNNAKSSSTSNLCPRAQIFVAEHVGNF
jgi:hypothetical protein